MFSNQPKLDHTPFFTSLIFCLWPQSCQVGTGHGVGTQIPTHTHTQRGRDIFYFLLLRQCKLSLHAKNTLGNLEPSPESEESLCSSTRRPYSFLFPPNNGHFKSLRAQLPPHLPAPVPDRRKPLSPKKKKSCSRL